MTAEALFREALEKIDRAAAASGAERVRLIEDAVRLHHLSRVAERRALHERAKAGPARAS